MKSGYLLIKFLWKNVDLFLIFWIGPLFPKINLGQYLISKTIGHDKTWVTCDSILAEVGGIVGVDCSWNMAEATFSKLKLMGLEPRKLPDVIPANPVNSGKIGKLTTAEAIASALMFCHQKEQAVEVMSFFKWGPAFLEMNSLTWK